MSWPAVKSTALFCELAPLNAICKMPPAAALMLPSGAFTVMLPSVAARELGRVVARIPLPGMFCARLAN